MPAIFLWRPFWEIFISIFQSSKTSEVEDSSRHDLLQIYSNLQRQRGFQIKSVGKKKLKNKNSWTSCNLSVDLYKNYVMGGSVRMSQMSLRHDLELKCLVFFFFLEIFLLNYISCYKLELKGKHFCNIAFDILRSVVSICLYSCLHILFLLTSLCILLEDRFPWSMLFHVLITITVKTINSYFSYFLITLFSEMLEF